MNYSFGIDHCAEMTYFSPCLRSLVGSWEEDVVDLVEDQHGKNKVLVSFNCETLKSDAAAEDHIRKFLPKLAGLDAVV